VIDRTTHDALATCDYYPGPAGYFEDGAGAVLEVKAHIAGLRDLHAAMMRLAVVALRTGGSRAVLVALDHRMRTLSVTWNDALAVLAPAVKDKLQLVALRGDTVETIPDDAQLRRIGHALRTSVREHRRRPARPRAFFMVLHVLLLRWLRRDAPIQIGALGEAVGASQPTIRQALDRLDEHIARDSQRRVELVAFPQRDWLEMTVRAKRIRGSIYFEDTSGRPRSVEQHLARLERYAPNGAALGGVLAAKHWDAQLDLEGVPRVDLHVTAPGDHSVAKFMTQVDPALRPTSAANASLAIAVHGIRRRQAFFTPRAHKRLAWADPVDTLLDLDELRLHDQSADLIRRLRGGP